MLARLTGIWLALIVPFSLAAATGGPEGPGGHAGFHLVYICTTVLAIALIWAFRRWSTSKAVRLLAVALMCAQALFLFGQIGELVIVIGHEGPHAGEDALLDPAHDIAALAGTAPGLLLSGVLLVALAAIVAARRATRSRTTTDAVGAAQGNARIHYAGSCPRNNNFATARFTASVETQRRWRIRQGLTGLTLFGVAVFMIILQSSADSERHSE